jgi:hypothetical protein
VGALAITGERLQANSNVAVTRAKKELYFAGPTPAILGGW